MKPTMTTADIAQLVGVTQRHVTGQIVKRPGFPKPCINASSFSIQSPEPVLYRPRSLCRAATCRVIRHHHLGRMCRLMHKACTDIPRYRVRTVCKPEISTDPPR